MGGRFNAGCDGYFAPIGQDCPPVENWLGWEEVWPQDRPMTMHIILPTVEQGIVWVTDTGIGLGNSSHFASVDKITNLPNQNAACSSWGDHGITICDRLGDWVKCGRIELSSPEATRGSLEAFCATMLSTIRIDPMQASRPSVILLTNIDSSPRLFFAKTGIPPIARETDRLLCAGDADNPCRIFVDQYYESSGKTIHEALLLAVHAMRKAHEFKAGYIGPPNAWVCSRGTFRRLRDSELQQCIRASETIDRQILLSASNFILDTTIAPSIELDHDKERA